ncbi:MAG TPA: pitrilysin family protein [Candidatus Krumholzibacteria bacterium]|nr:pitrilysin family protein [Candidatus Krumholzibacteria bacterium]HRX49948.1 pitrilysin family protein [Candidatus Krumholzibacteria bacterium]
MMRTRFLRRALLGAAALLVTALPAAAARQSEADAWNAGTAYPGARPPVFAERAPGVEVLTLENGLQVLLLPNPSQDMVSVVTQVKVGSASEDVRTSGMSHMLEHLLFNGSDRWSQEEQYELADRIGAWNNAHTTDFFTNYIMLVPREHLAEGVELQAEMLFRSIIPADKFEKERGIVVGEIVQARDRGGDEAGEEIRRALFADSSLELPTLGTLSTIRHMQRDDVWDFYKAHYVPNNMITTVAGNFDRDAALALLSEHFGAVAPGTLPARQVRPAPYIDRTRVITRRAGAAHVLALAFEAPGFGSPDYFPFLVLSRLLDAPASGLVTVALEALPAAERADAGAWWEQADGFGRLVLQLDLPAGADAARYHDLVLAALAQGVEAGVTEQDVAEVVRMSETETLIEREQLRQLAIGSAQPIAQGGVDFFLDYLAELERVTAEDVRRVLAAYLADAPHLAVHVLPKADAAADGAAAEVKVERSELPNGVVLVTLENPGSPLFAAHLTARNRAELDGDKPGAVNMVHRLLSKGLGGCDEECLARKLRALGAQVKYVDDPRFPMDDYYTNGRFSWVRLETAAAQGPEALVLLLDLIQHAGFTREDFEAERRAQLELVARDAGSARAVADAALADALYGEHALANPPAGTAQALEALGYDDVRRAFRRAFSPDNLVLAVVSPLPHAAVAGLVAEQVSGRAAAGPGLDPEPVTAAPLRVQEHVGGQMSSVRLGSLLRVAPGDAAALSLLTGVLSDRLAQDLRETRGLSYSVGAGLEVHGESASFEAWLNPPAPRLAEGEAALLEAVRGFDPASITQQELDAVRNARQGRLRMRRLSSIAQAYYLSMAELDGRVGDYLDPFGAAQAVTLADLVRVGRTYLKDLPLATVVVD